MQLSITEAGTIVLVITSASSILQQLRHLIFSIAWLNPTLMRLLSLSLSTFLCLFHLFWSYTEHLDLGLGLYSGGEACTGFTLTELTLYTLLSQLLIFFPSVSLFVFSFWGLSCSPLTFENHVCMYWLRCVLHDSDPPDYILSRNAELYFKVKSEIVER